MYAMVMAKVCSSSALESDCRMRHDGVELVGCETYNYQVIGYFKTSKYSP